MCGIAGACGFNALRTTLLLTLGQLSRGKLGTGVAWSDAGRVKVLKEPINAVKFVSKHFMRLEPRVKVAIGHNRQPSRGKVSFVNTHPFMSCDYKFALVHNGTTVFPNDVVRGLRREHRIAGETDSEVITHMLEEFYDECGDMVSAIEKLFTTSFQGAILVLTRDGKIYGAVKGHYPLHYSVTDKSVLLASESGAIANVLDDDVEIKALKSKQVIEVNGGKVEVFGEGEEELPLFKECYYTYFRRGLIDAWLDQDLI